MMFGRRKLAAMIVVTACAVCRTVRATHSLEPVDRAGCWEDQREQRLCQRDIDENTMAMKFEMRQSIEHVIRLPPAERLAQESRSSRVSRHYSDLLT